MAAGPFIIPDKSLLNMVNAVNLLNPAKTFKVTLHGSAMAPDPTAMEVFADCGAELAAGNGYTAGGLALANPAVALVGGQAKFSADAAEWTAAGGNIPAFRYAVVRAVGTFAGKVDPVLAYCLGDATGVDVPATTPTNKITFAPAAGIVVLDQAA